ncbi:hypothetical protein ACFWPA_04650 [Rhodococcus sp. NPDC058505]|uniref:hypothetical protein n=1 Tax=unclassified Rhodococcus (in: high G+C Gram-positive bacteria) TaxID=192944 RepID=UPI003664049A
MPDTSAPESPNPPVEASPRRAVPATLTAAVLTVVAGIWTITGTVVTYVPTLLVPSALGLPFAVPALRAWPLGRTTPGSWLVDVLAALVLIAVVAVRLARPARSRARAFGAGVGATVVGMLAANLIRVVYTSFVVHAGPGTYALMVLGGALVAVLWGAAAGLAVGAVHAATFRVAPADTPADAVAPVAHTPAPEAITAPQSP